MQKFTKRTYYSTNPEWDFVYFGDMLFGGRLLDRTKKRVVGGIEETYVEFLPSPDLMDLYGLDRGDLNSNGAVGVWYPSHFIHTANFDPKVGRRTLIICGFEKEETLIMNLIRGRLMKDEVGMRERDALKVKLMDTLEKQRETEEQRQNRFFEMGVRFSQLIRKDNKGEEGHPRGLEE